MNLHEFMRSYEAKIISNTNNLFEQQFLIHTDEVFVQNECRRIFILNI
jgi:hypothetical protein